MSDTVIIAAFGTFGLIITTIGTIAIAKINAVHKLVNSRATQQDETISGLNKTIVDLHDELGGLKDILAGKVSIAEKAIIKREENEDATT